MSLSFIPMLRLLHGLQEVDVESIHALVYLLQQAGAPFQEAFSDFYGGAYSPQVRLGLDRLERDGMVARRLLAVGAKRSNIVATPELSEVMLELGTDPAWEPAAAQAAWLNQLDYRVLRMASIAWFLRLDVGMSGRALAKRAGLMGGRRLYGRFPKANKVVDRLTAVVAARQSSLQPRFS